MPDALSQLWQVPGLIWLLLTIGIAGLVRGFTGFGTALIFVPVAGIFLPPATIITVMVLTGIISTFALLPRAWAQGARAEVGILALAGLCTVPLGIWFLGLLDATIIRWLVTIIAATTLSALLAGWRFSGHVSSPGLLLIGGTAGIIGGMTGLTGPVVILFYLAGQSAAQTVRANTILFLAALDIVIAGNLAFRGHVGLEDVMLAGALAVPYFTTTMIGQSLFSPHYERLYRWAAYGVIGLAVVTGLPLWE
jgi:uncharacterized membrane protein YfcA